jgi:hypothetical protein
MTSSIKSQPNQVKPNIVQKRVNNLFFKLIRLKKNYIIKNKQLKSSQILFLKAHNGNQDQGAKKIL